ncbi:MAG: cytochrome c biogenesis protein CcsA [Phycisphaerales bacterium]
MTRAFPILLAVLLAACPARPLAAQYAPAGNAHPEHSTLSIDDPESADIAFPFGRPGPATATLGEKLDFADALDLTAFRALAVQHDGRVKIIDTLARETVSALTGKNRHTIYVPVRDDEDGSTTYEKVKTDAVFTMLDIIIDPAFNANVPTIAIDFLPLRRAILEAELNDPELAERKLKLGMVAPAVIERELPAIAQSRGGDPAWRAAIMDTDSGLELFWYGSANLLMVPPASTNDVWHHLAEGSDEVRSAAQELGAAWRALDADRANAALATLAEALPAANPELYPGTRRELELAYNQSSPFEWGSWLYLLSFLLFVLAFGIGRRWMKIAGLTTFLLALALHGAGFAARCIVAERFAIQNQYESMTGLSLFAALVGLGLMLTRKQWLFGAAAAGTGFLVLVTATQTTIPGVSIGREAAILNTSVLLKYHVTTVLTSYGFITLGFVVSLFYLATHYGAKYFGRSEAELIAAGALQPIDPKAAGLEPRGTRDPNPAAFEDASSTDSSLSPPGRGQGEGSSSSTSPTPTTARTLKDLDTAQLIILQLAFWTLAVGILLGAWWADHSWGRWWAFDPKETWALVTWIIYLIVIHVRAAGVREKGLTTAWLSVVGFIVMLWTYFGVNLLLPGLHAYA